MDFIFCAISFIWFIDAVMLLFIPEKVREIIAFYREEPGYLKVFGILYFVIGGVIVYGAGSGIHKPWIYAIGCLVAFKGLFIFTASLRVLQKMTGYFAEMKAVYFRLLSSLVLAVSVIMVLSRF